MPITGVFKGDFSDFVSAVEQAEHKLVDLEGGAGKVGRRLNSMVDSFSGRKIVQDAAIMVEAVERVGGAANLTEKELAQVGAKAAEAAEKMRAMGMDVPERLQTLATHAKESTTAIDRMGVAVGSFIGNLASDLLQRGISGVLGLGSAAIETAGKINDLSAKLGISAEAVQGFMYAANQSGTTIDAFAAAIAKLSVNLAGDPKAIVPALNLLGLELAELRAMKPEDALLAIADAWAKLPESYDKVKAGQDLMGRSFTELIPSMKEGLRQTVEAATKMSNETVDRLARAEDFWQHAWDRFVVISAEGMSKVAGIFEKSAQESPVGFGAALMNVAKMFGLVESAAPKAGAAIAGTVPPTESAAQAQARAVATLQDYEERQREAARAAAESAREAAAAAKKAAEEHQQWADTLAKVTEQARPYQEVLAENDAQLNEWIQSLLRAGASVEDIARAYQVSTTYVQANSAALKENDATLKAMERTYADLGALTEEYHRLVEERTLSTVDRQIAEINRWVDHTKGKLMERNTLTAESEAMIDAIATERIDKLMVNEDTLHKTRVDNAVDRLAIEQNTLQQMLDAEVGTYTPATIAAQQQVVAAAEAAANEFTNAWQGGFADTASAAQAGAQVLVTVYEQAAQQVATTWSEAMEQVRQGKGTMEGAIPTGPGTMTNYGPWGSPAHAAAVQRAYAEGRYFGPVVSRPPSAARPGYGGESVGPDWEALGIKPPPGSFTWGNIGPMAAGGPVAARTPYLVGEQGPELFVPQTAGAILPNASGGVVFNNVFNVNGTGHDVARIVSAELTRLMRQGRKWPAV